MKKIFFAIITIASFTACQKAKNMVEQPLRNDSKFEINQSVSKTNDQCKLYVEQLKTKTRSQLKLADAITQMEGAANYTYARYYKQVGNFSVSKNTYTLSIEPSGMLNKM